MNPPTYWCQHRISVTIRRITHAYKAILMFERPLYAWLALKNPIWLNGISYGHWCYYSNKNWQDKHFFALISKKDCRIMFRFKLTLWHKKLHQKKILVFILDKCYECYDVNLLTFTSRIRLQICILILILQDLYFNEKGNLDKYFA